jgi:hypothetical protein
LLDPPLREVGLEREEMSRMNLQEAIALAVHGLTGNAPLSVDERKLIDDAERVIGEAARGILDKLVLQVDKPTE